MRTDPLRAKRATAKCDTDVIDFKLADKEERERKKNGNKMGKTTSSRGHLGEREKITIGSYVCVRE